MVLEQWHCVSSLDLQSLQMTMDFVKRVTTFILFNIQLLVFSSDTSHQRSSTESSACPCLPLIVSPSGRETNWRNESGSSETTWLLESTKDDKQPRQRKANGLDATDGSLTCWLPVSCIVLYSWQKNRILASSEHWQTGELWKSWTESVCQEF